MFSKSYNFNKGIKGRLYQTSGEKQSKIYDNLFELIKSHKHIEFINAINELKFKNEVDYDENTNNDMDIYDINVRDNAGNYLITYAIILNQPSLVKFLISKGARVDVIDNNDRSILFVPIFYSFYELTELLLETNEKTIGVSIVNIRDKKDMIPLHYAIESRNKRIVELLLKYDSNPNLKDIHGYNSLHFAVRSRDIEIVKLIITVIDDINTQTNDGENALHLACSLQLYDISKLLIESGININQKDNKEATPIFHTIVLNNRELCKLLLDNGANVNVQDIYGNSPIHYCIMEDHYSIFKLLTDNREINYNIWNYLGDLPIHAVFKKNIEDPERYLDVILEGSNVSIQDFYGNTALYYLVKSGLWIKYKHILVTKRLNIFSINNDKKMLIDLVPKTPDFMNLLVDSYLYRLRKGEAVWNLDWENVCSKKYSELTDDDKKTLSKKKLDEKEFDDTCRNFVLTRLNKLIKKAKEGKLTNCYDQSFPVRRGTICIEIQEGDRVEFSTFTGTTLDILIGLLHILEKHKTLCCSVITQNYKEHHELSNFYKSNNIIADMRTEFMNIEVAWVYHRLFLTEGFYEQFRKCASSKRFVVIPIGIVLSSGGHAGYLIYDNKTKEIERFEPHGDTIPKGFDYKPDLLDEILELKIKEIDEEIKYIRPREYLPKVGLQSMDSREKDQGKIGDPDGFCALWSVWYVDMRLTYHHLHRKKLVNLLLSVIKTQNISFKNMIRNYGQHIVNWRDKLFKKVGMNINDWLNDKYTPEQFREFNEILIEQIVKITSY